jgi:hypothetical protein
LPLSSERRLSRRASSASTPTDSSTFFTSAADGDAFPPVWRRRYAAMCFICARSALRTLPHEIKSGARCFREAAANHCYGVSGRAKREGDGARTFNPRGRTCRVLAKRDGKKYARAHRVESVGGAGPRAASHAVQRDGAGAAPAAALASRPTHRLTDYPPIMVRPAAGWRLAASADDGARRTLRSRTRHSPPSSRRSARSARSRTAVSSSTSSSTSRTRRCVLSPCTYIYSSF